MATAAQVLKLRRGTASENDAFSGANGEVTVDTTNKTLRVHDGVNVGGNKLVSEAGLALNTAGLNIGVNDSSSGSLFLKLQDFINIFIPKIKTTIKGDGGTSDSTNILKQAFDYAIPLGLPVELEGVFRITGPIQPYATRSSGALHIVCRGEVKIMVDAASAGFTDVLYFHTTAINSASITGGDLVIEGASKAGRGITIRHEGGSGGRVTIDSRLKIKDILETDASATRENEALAVVGRYDAVTIEQPYIQNVNRTNAAGATKGISVSQLAGVCTINEPFVENVLCVSSANTDADGISVFGYQAGGANSARQGTAVINEPTLKNCQGRSMKAQVSDASVYRPRVIRSGAVVAIAQGADFDFQFCGTALVHEPVYEYYESGGVSPFSAPGSSFSAIVFQQTLDDRDMAARSVGGTMYTQVQLPRYASLILGATAKESLASVAGLRVIPVGSFSSSAFGRAIVEFDASIAVAKSSRTKIEVGDIRGPVQCYGIGYTGYSSGSLAAKLSVSVTDMVNTLGPASAAQPFFNLSGSRINEVEYFLFRNMHGFRDLMASGWTFNFNKLAAGCSFTVDIATVAATNAPSWGSSEYAFIECKGGGYFGSTDRNVLVTKANADAANTVFYTRDGGTTWGTIK